MSYPFFATIARMKYIGRWGLMRNTVQENIQDDVGVNHVPHNLPASLHESHGGPAGRFPFLSEYR